MKHRSFLQESGSWTGSERRQKPTGKKAARSRKTAFRTTSPTALDLNKWQGGMRIGFARYREPNCRGIRRSILRRPQQQSAEESAVKTSRSSALFAARYARTNVFGITTATTCPRAHSSPLTNTSVSTCHFFG